jgi:PAS domain S-box-containing protein
MHIIDRERESLAENVLLESEGRGLRTVDFLSDGVTVIEQDKVMYVNDRACEIFGYPKEELVKLNGFDLAAPEEKERLRKIAEEARRTGIPPKALEFWIIRKDRTRRCVWNRYSISHKDDGRITRYVITADITERKRMEDALRSSEWKYRTLFANVPHGIYQNTPDGRILTANPALVRMLGYDSESELLAADISRDLYVNPEDRKAWVHRLEEGGQLRDAELVLKRKDGRKITCLDNCHVVRDECGTVLYYEGTLTDITERKRMEEEIRSLARFPSENPNPVLRLDRHGIVLSANEASKLLLHEWRSGIGQVAPKFWRDLVTDVLSGRQSRNVDVEFGGKSYTFLVKPIMRTDYVNLYGRDITERKSLEDELKRHAEHLEELVRERTADLRESEEKYRTLVMTSPDAVVVTDLEGRITDVSQQALEIHGFESSKECIGRSVVDLVAPEDHEKAVMNLHKILSEGIVRNVEYSILKKDGTTFTGELSSALIADTQGKPRAFIGIIRDITERRTIEKIRDRLISGVTHELRTPLGPLKVHLEYALSGKFGPISEKLKSSLQVMKRSTDRLVELTDQLLDIRRLRSGKFELTLQPVDIREVIDQSMKEAQVSLDIKNQRLHVEVPERPLTLRVDSTRLSQVLANLLSNASSFTPENGQITIKVDDEAEALKVSVSDTGIGIRKEDLSMVFQPFAAIRKPTWMKGAGLGLSISKGIVEAHGGKIWVESDGEGKGATFTFTLPKLKEES